MTVTSDIVFSACPHDCPSTCALEVERLDAHHIGRVRGAKDQSYTAGVICAKVARYAERVHHPDRLAYPMRRVGAKGSGRFERIGWDSALDLLAEKFVAATQKHGSESVWPYYYAGTMGLVQRDGINRLRHVMRYSGQKTTICTTLADAGWLAGAGGFVGPDPREMGEADLIVMWGGNPASTQVNVMHHVSRARKERGAKFVVIDPYRTRTAAVADKHLALRPGTDGALACAVMHVLFRDGYADLDYLRRYTDFPDELRQHLSARDPAWAAAITGLSEAEIIEFARLYGSTKRSYIRLGYGFTRSRNGAANMHAATCLPSVTGAWRHLGGGAFYSNREIFHWDKTVIEGLDARDPSVRVLDMSRIGPVLTNDPKDVGAGPPVTAMLIQNCNPVVVAPEANRVRAGFLRDDLFVCVHEQFMTNTAAMADLVLPATTFLEHDDIYQGGGHQHIELGPKVIEPYAETRSNHDVLCGLAARLGAEHPGFRMSAIELVDDLLRRSGWPDVEYFRREHWLDCQPDFETSHHLKGFRTPDGKFRFSPDWAKLGPYHAGMPSLPDHHAIIEAADADHPFRMIAPPAHNFLNSTFSETKTGRRIEARPAVLVHPEDCARLGIAEGDLVRLGNRRGEVRIHAKTFDGMQPGVLVVEGIWPNSDYVGGMGINALTSADAAPPMGGAVFHDAAVWLRPA
ncbi:MAG: molybdopterin-dependent oxidoreductase [Alphaproteobacteria bacterium]